MTMSIKNDNSAKYLELFLKIGLDENTANNTIRDKKGTSNLTAIIDEVGVTDGCDRAIGNALYSVATTLCKEALVHRSELLKYIISSKIKSPAQVVAAISFLNKIGSEDLNLNDFEEACGVGVEVSEEDIKKTVNEIFEENMETILDLRYKFRAEKLLGLVKKRLVWADPRITREVIDEKTYELLGERTDADNEKPTKTKKAAVEADGKPTKTKKAAVEAAPEPSEEESNPYSIFPQPNENIRIHTEVPFSNDRPVLECRNTKELLDEHLKVTGGKVYTRFPPEPNGYLHIGHAKAMFVNFGLAKERNGCCYLRFDDTNPEAEKEEYITHIEDIVKWMDWEPFKITYTSDYFDKLYDLAVELIRTDLAYVDHQTKEEIEESRKNKTDSLWRKRPIEESLKLFDDMKRGEIKEGATLRMKQDMQNNNYNMYDLVAYRIQFKPHPRTGDKWCIYPTYDFSHCIIDSLENITHSLCTLEFETRRASYYWLLHSLKLYMPYVWEYSRLNVSNNVMSKRKLNDLVTNNHVDGWDDPRLLTLAGLRRRGVTSTAINAFIRGMGITRSDGSTIHMNRLENYIRKELENTAPRTMVVLDPLKVVITNMESDKVMELDAKRLPDDKSDDPSSFYKVPFSRVVYIERADFRIEDSDTYNTNTKKKDKYHGLAPGKYVFLRHAFRIKCTEVVLADDNETVVEIHAEYDHVKKPMPKGVLHWVAEPAPGKEPMKVEVRLFEDLFNSEKPAELENWLDDINTNSKVVASDAFAVPSLRDAVLGDKFQFERLGYFAVDKDSTPEKPVFNRTSQ